MAPIKRLMEQLLIVQQAILTVSMNMLPIPVQEGDILGVFIPRTSVSRPRLLSENMNGPTNYYLETGFNVFDMLDIQDRLVQSQDYHPMVSVEIGKRTQLFVFPVRNPATATTVSDYSINSRQEDRPHVIVPLPRSFQALH